MTVGGPVLAAFDARLVVLPIEKILPARTMLARTRASTRFERIRSSMAEVGLVEPLVVAPARDGCHLLLDGHSRLAVLRETGATEVRCLVATDDEAFTYNRRVSHLATIQEHRMIARALDKGVPEARLAKALNVDVAHIRRLRSMLEGICAEAIDLLKDKRVNPQVFRVMRRMRPMRQVKVAELMTAAGNYTASYADLLLVGTPNKDLLHPEKPKKLGGLTPEQISKMEREMEAVSIDFRNAEEAYGRNVFDLVVAKGYVGKLLRNKDVSEFLARSFPEIHEGLRSMADEMPFEAALA